MYAKYIKKEVPDLNGTGQTQAFYKMKLTPKSYEEFVSQCAREEAFILFGVNIFYIFIVGRKDTKYL